MAIPIIFGGIAAATGITGAVKGVKGALDSHEASEVQERAERILRKAQSMMEKKKAFATKEIQDLGKTKLDAYANQINHFVETYAKIKGIELTDSIGIDEMKKMQISEAKLKEMRDTALSAKDVVGGGITGVGAGVLLGWGTYGGVMALGTASTGTAIASLSGAAATNATLAWLGGGAIAAGGGGMALGSVILGGIVAGPALLVAGTIFGASAKAKLDNAYGNLAEMKVVASQLEAGSTELHVIGINAEQLHRLLKELVMRLNGANNAMNTVVANEIDWKNYSKAEKEIVIGAMKLAQLVKGIIDTPLLTEDGVLTKDIKFVIENQEGILENEELVNQKAIITDNWRAIKDKVNLKISNKNYDYLIASLKVIWETDKCLKLSYRKDALKKTWTNAPKGLFGIDPESSYGDVSKDIFKAISEVLSNDSLDGILKLAIESVTGKVVSIIYEEK